MKGNLIAGGALIAAAVLAMAGPALAHPGPGSGGASGHSDNGSYGSGWGPGFLAKSGVVKGARPGCDTSSYDSGESVGISSTGLWAGSRRAGHCERQKQGWSWSSQDGQNGPHMG